MQEEWAVSIEGAPPNQIAVEINAGPPSRWQIVHRVSPLLGKTSRKGANKLSALSDGLVVHFAANVATVLFVVAIILQLLLATGILPISMAWGGRQTVLTTTLRFASLAAAAILVFFAYVIRDRAGLVGDETIPTTIIILSWFITAFMTLNTVINLASQSIGEKILFTPISFLLAVSCSVVSSSRT